MAVKKKSENRLKKEDRWAKIIEACKKYKNVMFINADNVSSKQILSIRAKLREIDAVMIMGKNTLMKAALAEIQSEDPKAQKIIQQLKYNINVIFSNGDLGEVKSILDKEDRPSPAKIGMIAPSDVHIPIGPTGLDPKQTSFFQTLQIQTKIMKGQIDIVAEKQVIFTGEKIGSTQAALLDKLKIYPFSYKMHVTKVYQDGSLFDAAVLNLDTDAIKKIFKRGIDNQAKLSLGIGYTTEASAPHTLAKGFKNMLAFSCATDYTFPQAQKFLGK